MRNDRYKAKLVIMGHVAATKAFEKFQHFCFVAVGLSVIAVGIGNAILNSWKVKKIYTCCNFKFKTKLE